jgi:hypothetical protein
LRQGCSIYLDRGFAQVVGDGAIFERSGDDYPANAQRCNRLCRRAPVAVPLDTAHSRTRTMA